MAWLGFAVLCAVLSGLRDAFAKHASRTVSSNYIAFLQYLLAAPILIFWAGLSGVPEIKPDFFWALPCAVLLVSTGALLFLRR